MANYTPKQDSVESAKASPKPAKKGRSRRAAKGKQTSITSVLKPLRNASSRLRQRLGLGEGTPLPKWLNRTSQWSPQRRPLLWLGVGAVGFSSGVLVAFTLGVRALDQGLPDTAEIATFVRDGTLTLKASDGTILQQLGPATRDRLKIDQVPPRVLEAFIATEDRRFYQHTGVDYPSIARATLTNLFAGGVVEGGSTITQQLARMVFLNQERSITRKLREARLAQKIERELSKEQILERYLDLVYLGSGAYGVTDAAWAYFSKSVDKLTLGEIATIAGLPPAPSAYSPLIDLDTAQVRRDIVLARMLEAGFISAQEAADAKESPLKLTPGAPKRLYSETPYFTSFVQKELPKYVPPEVLEASGLTVETTMNLQWQKFAQAAIKDAIELDGPAQGFEQAALVAIDPRNGEVKAIVGGSDFNKTQFNRATQAQRQPGSTFKTFVYTAAIAAGFSPYDGYLDAPYTVDGYSPKNYSRKYTGWVSMRDALINSVNVVAVRTIVDVGFDPTIKMAQGMGVKSKLNPTYSLALGASEVNLLELTSAYGALAAQGKHVEPHAIRRIINRRGEVIYDAKFSAKQVVDKGSAAIMTWMLEGVVQSGTGKPAQLGRPVAGKTGTSEEARDLWFVGYIPQVVAGVWLGNDDNYPTWGSSGTAAYVWREFMADVVKGMAAEEFPDLPTLDGRKGSIKAQPVQPKRAYYSSAPAESESQSSSDSYSSSEERYYDSGYDSGYSSGGSSESYYEEPAPEPAPPAEEPVYEEPSYEEPSYEEAPPPSEPVMEEAPPPPPEPALEEPAPPSE